MAMRPARHQAQTQNTNTNTHTAARRSPSDLLRREVLGELEHIEMLHYITLHYTTS